MTTTTSQVSANAYGTRDENPIVAGSNQFELLLFRLGAQNESGRSELYGINVLKVREIVATPEITPMAGASKFSLGIVHLRNQIIPVYDLPAIIGCKPSGKPALMLITEYARSTQAFIVESVEDIARLDWSRVTSAEDSGTATNLITSIAHLNSENGEERLALVLDVETVLQMVTPLQAKTTAALEHAENKGGIRPGAFVLAADDSPVARSIIEKTLQNLGVNFEVVNTGKQAWDRLNTLRQLAEIEGKTLYDKVSLMLTDLEMPEMDGFALAHNIKNDPRMQNLPVVIHSSLSGTANEDRVRTVGANGYVAKFSVEELSNMLRTVLAD